MTEPTPHSAGAKVVVGRCKCGHEHSVPEEIADEAVVFCGCGRKVYFRSGRRVSVLGVAVRLFAGLAGLALLAGLILAIGYAVSDFEGFRARVGRLGRWVAGRAGGQTGPEVAPPAPEDSAEEVLWRVTTRGGDLLRGQPQLEAIHVESPLGRLVVPRKDIRWIVPGLHTPMEVRREVADRIDALGGELAEVRAASDRLLEIGADALPQLWAAEAGRELRVAAAARDLARKIVERVGHVPREDDYVATRYFPIVGQIHDSLELKTELGQIRFAWREVARVDRDELAGISWAEPPGPARPGLSSGSGPPEMVVESRDGSTLVGQLRTPVLRLETPYGTLRVPGPGVTMVEIWEASEIELAERAGRELLAAPDEAARLAAIDRLAALGALGASMLQRAAESGDAVVVQAARKHLAELDGQGQSYPAGPHRVILGNWTLGGTIQNAALRFQLPSASQTEGGDLTIPVTMLRRMTVRSLQEEDRGPPE